MSIWKRLKDITAANVNALIDKAEDPVKMLEQFIRDMGEDILDAEQAVAKQIALEKSLQQKYEEKQALVNKRQEQAEKAIEAGNEDLARRALLDKKEVSDQANDFKRQYDLAKGNADKLRHQLTEMKDEFSKMKNKKETLIARAEAAKAQKQINDAMSGFGVDNAARGFDRMQEKVLKLEAEAEASEELRGSNKSLDAEFDSLDKSPSAVDDELAALKAKLGKKTE